MKTLNGSLTSLVLVSTMGLVSLGLLGGCTTEANSVRAASPEQCLHGERDVVMPVEHGSDRSEPAANMRQPSFGRLGALDTRDFASRHVGREFR